MKNIQWNNKLGPRERAAFLFLIKGESIHKFKGQSIPEVCLVVNEKFTKDGKWSNTTYSLRLDYEVREIAGRQDFESGATFTQSDWSEVAAFFGVPIDSAKAFLVTHYPKTAGKYNEVEAFGGAK